MIIIFFSDIHGNQYAYNSFLKNIESIHSDLVVFGGDVFGYYYGQDEILEDLRKRDFVCLMGNHDKMFLDYIDGKIKGENLIIRYGNSYKGIEKKISDKNKEFVRTFKENYQLSVDGMRIYFCHGSKSDNLNGRIYPDTNTGNLKEYAGIDYAFHGHTHHQVEKNSFGCTIINPGSLGQQRDGLGCKYVIFNTDNRIIQINKIEYDVESLVTEVSINDVGKMKERLIEVLYRKSNKNN